MSATFFDTNLLVYAFSDDIRRGIARAALEVGGTISVQSLNEFASVARRKRGFSWPEVRSAIESIRVFCPKLVVLDEALHVDGLRLAERYGFSIYDALIVAAALSAQCDVLLSEDLHEGLVVEGRLRIVNPFHD